MKVIVELQSDSIKLALIQWYDFNSKSIPYIYGCSHLKLTEIYNLVEIESIQDIVHIHVISRFDKINKYFENK